MKFKINFLISLICVILYANPVILENTHDMASTVILPVASAALTALAIPPPVGPVLAGALGLMNVCNNIFKSEENEKDVAEVLSKVDLLDVQLAMMDEIKTVDAHIIEQSEMIIRELTMTVETHEFFEKLRKTLDYIRRTYVDKMKVVINRKVVGPQKESTFQDMMNYDSRFRRKLRSFVSDFIAANSNGLALLKPIKLFFDYLLDKENLLALTQDDCNSDSLHSRVFKSFLYIIKVLTEGYVMAVSAHVIQYQNEIETGKLDEAAATRDNAISLFNEYKTDMNTLINKTKWALNNANKEIRNCGNFELVEGKTFERISFSQILPKISYFEYIDVFEYKCVAENRYLNMTDYDIGNCNDHADVVPLYSQLSIVSEPTTEEKWPYSSMNVLKLDKTEQLFGHNKTTKSSVANTYKMHPECYTTFCTAFRKKSYAISTQRVSAEHGNVITGLRFRVRNKIIYIDIQQGKYLDSLSVDPKVPVYWTETPESNQIAYLGSKLKKIELGDFLLQNNSILTSIQLRNTNFRGGLIKVIVGGFTPSLVNNSVSYMNEELELNELKLDEGDDPEMAAAISSKNLISKPPVADKRYYVSFQPSNFEKDFGRSTIPYLDTRECISYPPAPLNGIRFYHEAVNGSGGMIAMSLIQPNLADLINFEQLEQSTDSFLKL